MLWHCPFKYITNIPCPGCGTTRAVSLLLHGKISQALYTNPLGIVLTFIILLGIFTKGIDLLFKTDYFNRFFISPFNNLKAKHKILYICFLTLCVALCVGNSYWNYCKGL